MSNCINNLYFQEVVSCKETPNPTDDLFLDDLDTNPLIGFWGYLYTCKYGQKIKLVLNAKKKDESNDYFPVNVFPSNCGQASLVFWGTRDNNSYLFVDDNSILSWLDDQFTIVKYDSSKSSFTVNAKFFPNSYKQSYCNNILIIYNNVEEEAENTINVNWINPQCFKRRAKLSLGDSV